MREIFEKVPEEFVSKTATYDQKVPIISILEDIDRLGAVIITNSGEYAGIVDQRAIARKGSLKLEDKYACGKFAKKVPIVTDSTSITDAMGYFYTSSSKALPYMKGSKIIGIVKRRDMLKAALSMHMLSKAKASQIMASPVISIESSSNMAQAQKLMQDNSIHRLVVLENGKLYGLLTHKDIVRYGARSEGGSRRQRVSTTPAQIRVGDICSRSPNSIEHDESVESGIRQLVTKDVSSLVVVRNGRPVGMLSVRDVIERVVQSGGKVEEKILISGLTPKTEEYREELHDSLSSLAERLDKFAKIDVEFVSLNVKDIKSNTYEMKARVGLAGAGVINVSVTGHTLERTLKDLEAKVYKVVQEKKDIRVTSAREAESSYEKDES